MTYREYHDEILAIAKEAIARGEDERSDYIHETIDGHELIIYTNRNLLVLQHTDNLHEADDCLDDSTARSVTDSLTSFAYFAMYADVWDKVHAIEDK